MHNAISGVILAQFRCSSRLIKKLVCSTFNDAKAHDFIEILVALMTNKWEKEESPGNPLGPAHTLQFSVSQCIHHLQSRGDVWHSVRTDACLDKWGREVVFLWNSLLLLLLKSKWAFNYRWDQIECPKWHVDLWRFLQWLLAFISSSVGRRFPGPTEENSVGAAYLDRVGLGSKSQKGPPWVWAVGTVNTGFIGRKRPSFSSLEERNCRVSSGFGAGVIHPWGHHHTCLSFSHTRWSLPWSWQAEAPLVPFGQYLQARVCRKQGHLERRRREYCPQAHLDSVARQMAGRAPWVLMLALLLTRPANLGESRDLSAPQESDLKSKQLQPEETLEVI